jgi:hypothetical protein
VLVLLSALVFAGAAQASSGAAAPATATEEQVRAGFLFQLAQYAYWPPESFPSESTPMRFCVLGQDNLAGTLMATLRGKRIQGRPLVIESVKEPEGLSGCHVAFVGFRREKQLRDTFAKWSYPPVLLVGEAERFAELGGLVNLVIQSGRVSFEINLEAAARAHLGFRSQLLRFARIVSSTPGGVQ